MGMLAVVAEIVCVALVVVIACLISMLGVKLVNRSIVGSSRRRKSIRPKPSDAAFWVLRRPLALWLTEEYAEKNERATTSTATKIRVSSTGFFKTVEVLVGFVVTWLLNICHQRGMAQIMIDTGVNANTAFCNSAAFFAVLGFLVGLVAKWLAIYIQAATARSLADVRIERGHEVIFVQAKGLDERIADVVWAVVRFFVRPARRHRNR